MQKPRGAETRELLVQTAISVFGRDGFHAASTRHIAQQAGVNQALISYHYGGKEGLYLAAMKHIADSVAERIGPLAEEIRKRIEGYELLAITDMPTARENYLAELFLLTDAIVNMLVDKQSSAWAQLILREQQQPSPALDIIYEGMMKNIMTLLTLLVSRIRSVPAESSEVTLLAITVFSQAHIFRASRASVLRLMGWQDIGRKECAIIQSQIRSNIRAMLLTETHQ